MRKIKNTLYVTKPGIYISREGECLMAIDENKKSIRIPAQNLEGLVYMGYPGISPMACKLCLENNITISIMEPNGKFITRMEGSVKGSVLTRKKQYLLSEDKILANRIASRFLVAKIANYRTLLIRAKRDHGDKIPDYSKNCRRMKKIIEDLLVVPSYQEILGLEGEAALEYFDALPGIILSEDEDFKFVNRNRRPPTDRINCLLSFLYSLLSHECTSACESVGLDPQVGFLHKDRPGRPSLALDLMEELRAVFADRMVLNLVNRGQIKSDDFIVKPQGEITLKDNARKTILDSWQKKKQSTLVHPYLNEKIEFGLIPYVQAFLLSKYIRKQIDEYPAFIWR